MSRSGIMLAQPFEEKRLARWNTNSVIIQPKLDGERARAVFDHLGHVTLYSSESNIITSVPHINEQLEGLKLHDIEFDGELYVHEKPFEQIHSIVSRKVNEHYNSASMEYHIFDLVTPDPQRLRLIALNVFLSNETDNIKRIKWTEVVNFNNVVGALNAYKSEGYEGIILRHPAAPYVRKRSPFMMKFKPKKSDVYKIVGFQEEISIHGVPKNRLGAFILEGDDGTKFGVGTGFDDSQRAFFWQNREDCVGKWCEVQYQSITQKGKVPRFPVFVQVRTDIL